MGGRMNACKRKELASDLSGVIMVAVMQVLSRGHRLSAEAIDCRRDVEFDIEDCVYPIVDAALAALTTTLEE